MGKNPLQTKLCEQLGIEFPIVAFTHCKDVAAAVINAGGFAVMGETHHTPDEMAADIKWLQENTHGRPFGIDLVFPASVPPKATIDELLAQIPEEQREFVADMKKRHNLPPPKNVPELYDLGWMTLDTPRKQLEVALDMKIPVLASGLGNPQFVIDAAHDKGMLVWGLVGRVRQAKRELAHGVDALVATGYDAGGHTGKIGTFSIVPSIVNVAGDVPVIAAGGITTGQHLAGSLALGAAGVWAGTVWLTSRESDREMNIKEMLLNATQDDTVWSNCISGMTMRTLNSEWHKEWNKPTAPRPAPPPYQILLFADIKQSAIDHKRDDFLTEASGQGVDFITEMKPAKQIVFDMVEECLAVFENLTGLEMDE